MFMSTLELVCVAACDMVTDLHIAGHPQIQVHISIDVAT